MEAMKAGAVAVLLCGVALTCGGAQQPRANLYGAAVQAALDRGVPSERIEYLLFDLHENRVEAMRSREPDQAIPAGSLLKPFVALAYANLQHSDDPDFPSITCRGKVDGCWRSAGHGSMTFERAVAESCNAYFLALARTIVSSPEGSQAMVRISEQYGIPSPFQTPDVTIAAPDLIGLSSAWRMSPVALAHAYARLLTQTNTKTGARLRQGMRMAALEGGTASHVGAHPGGVLAKTGTAPCIATTMRTCTANGDGLVVVAFPAEEPSQLLLVRERGTTGAEAAVAAGVMLSLLEKRDATPR